MSPQRLVILRVLSRKHKPTHPNVIVRACVADGRGEVNFGNYQRYFDEAIGDGDIESVVKPVRLFGPLGRFYAITEQGRKKLAEHE